MLSVSFYLLTPDAKGATQVYVSISDKTNRLRFAAGESFLTEYCNIRKKKGFKELVKRNTAFYFKYNDILKQIRDSLHLIEIDLKGRGKASLEEIRDEYYLRIGRGTGVSLQAATDSFLTSSQWSLLRLKTFRNTFNHFNEFDKEEKVKIETFSVENWNRFRDSYCAAKKKYSNPTTNTYLRALKQFIGFCLKKGIIRRELDLSDLKFQKELPDVFNISLKNHEVETLIKLNLSPTLGRIRDLFLLEVFTGQRYSDLHKMLNKDNLKGTSIKIVQQKTSSVATIPVHPRLKLHLTHIFEKYPQLPVVHNSNFNRHLKEICKLAGFDKKHTWVKLVGKHKIEESDFRYNLVTTHTGRRTFCNLARKMKISLDDIMKVTGHKSYDQLKSYMKVDDEDLELAFEMDILK